MKKVQSYMPEIEDGHPIPRRTKQQYERKIIPGGLAKLAAMKVGQSAIVPVGSLGRLKAMVRQRGGLDTVSQAAQDDREARVWVIRKSN